MTDLLWITAPPAAALGLALARSAALLRRSRPQQPLAAPALVVALGLCALSLMWTATALNVAMFQPEQVAGYVAGSKALSPVLVAGMGILLFAGSAVRGGLAFLRRLRHRGVRQ